MPTKVILKYILTYFLDCNLINYHSTTEIQLGNHPKYVSKTLKINNLILYIKSTIALVSLGICSFFVNDHFTIVHLLLKNFQNFSMIILLLSVYFWIVWVVSDQFTFVRLILNNTCLSVIILLLSCLLLNNVIIIAGAHLILPKC